MTAWSVRTGMVTLALALTAQSAGALAQDAPSPDAAQDDGPIMIEGSRSQPTPMDSPPPIFTTNVPAGDDAEPITDPVELARKRAPLELVADNALLLERLKRQDMVHRLRGIDVPLRLLPPEPGQPKASIWHSGPMPDVTLLARLRTVPVGEALATVTTKNGETKELRLAEAAWRPTSDPKPTFSLAGKLYCGRDVKLTAEAGTMGAVNMCLIDEDRDGVFDAYAQSEGAETGTVHSLYLIGPPLPLAKPVAYSVVEQPTLTNTAEWHNCGKDWDLPYFRPYLLAGDVPLAAPSRLSAERHGVYCDKAEAVTTILPTNKGGRVASLGGLVFDIDKKSSGAGATVVELRQQDRIYREEDGKVVPLSVGMTPTHVNIATAQLFDQKPYQYNGQSEIKEGSFGTDEVFLTLGFKHGYTGTVTQDISIRTLLSKREVAAGTAVFGVPAEKRTVLVGGYGGDIYLGPPVKREVNTAIVWCLPNREEEIVRDRKTNMPTGEIKIIWNATCLPETSAGNHTILQDQQPALAVRDMRMDANISTNDGPAPVKQTDSADFGGTLKFRYSVKSVSGRFVTLKEEVLLGEEITSTKDVLILNLGTNGAPFTASGGSFTLKIEDGESEKPRFTLEKVRDLEVDESVAVQGIDIMALLRRMMNQPR